MKLWFARKKTSPKVELAIVSLPKLEMTHTVTHTVKYLPRPKPTRLQAILINDEGQRWFCPPLVITGQYAGMISFPLSWATGNPNDNGKQVSLEITMDYQPLHIRKGIG